jgi:hypothetical protein
MLGKALRLRAPEQMGAVYEEYVTTRVESFMSALAESPSDRSGNDEALSL